jgi:hypoxanthine phosphoribosyltransferase
VTTASRVPQEAPSPTDDRADTDAVNFAHASERQFARLLDFYQIDWRYEPTSFDLEWDKDGHVVQRFTPDFYLPAYDLYIEITTLNQKLVTRKNRKVRRLRELYPDVQCKVFYQRDYLSLVTKYGLDGGGLAGPATATPNGGRSKAS